MVNVYLKMTVSNSLLPVSSNAVGFCILILFPTVLPDILLNVSIDVLFSLVIHKLWVFSFLSNSYIFYLFSESYHAVKNIRVQWKYSVKHVFDLKVSGIPILKSKKK